MADVDEIGFFSHAETLGYDSVWTAEAYGSDALTPLAWIGASPSRIRLGTGIVNANIIDPAVIFGAPPAPCAGSSWSAPGTG